MDFNPLKAEADDDSICGGRIRSFSQTRWTVRGESIASILEGQAVAKKTVLTLKGMRTDDMFKLFFGNKRIGANKPCLPRKRKAPSSLAMEFRAGDHYHPMKP